MRLYLAEYYDVEDDISFAWIRAIDKSEARRKLYQHKSCEEIIKIDEQYEIFPLALDGGYSIIIE